MYGVNTHLPRLVNLWRRYKEDFPASVGHKQMRKYTFTIFIRYGIVLLLAGTLQMYIYIYFQPDVLNSSMTGGQFTDYIVWVIFGIFGIFEMWMFLSFLVFLTTISGLLSMEFKQVALEMKTDIDNTDIITRNGFLFEEYRLNHRKIKELVLAVNDIFYGQFIVVFSMSIPFIFSLIFLLSNTNSWNSVGLGTNIFGAVWCTAMICNIIVICLAGDSVTEAVSMANLKSYYGYGYYPIMLQSGKLLPGSFHFSMHLTRFRVSGRGYKIGPISLFICLLVYTLMAGLFNVQMYTP